MDSGCEVEGADDFVGVVFPQARGLRVALECAKARDDFAGKEGRAFQMLNPPFAKCTIRADEETLLWGRRLTKCVGYVCSIDE